MPPSSARFPYADALHVLWDLAGVLDAGRGRPESQRALQMDYNFYVENERVRIVARKRGSPIDTVVAEMMIFVNSEWGRLLAEAGVAAIYRSQNNGKVRMSTVPAAHQGLGVAQYIWASSPLRRYVDLVNQRQLIAWVRGEPPPYAPKSERLLTAMRDFEQAYEVYGEFQRTMERYWCLRWLVQESVTATSAEVIREILVKVTDIPLITKVHGLPELEPGTLVNLAISDIDLLEVSFRAEFRGVAASCPEMTVARCLHTIRKPPLAQPTLSASTLRLSPARADLPAEVIDPLAPRPASTTLSVAIGLSLLLHVAGAADPLPVSGRDIVQGLAGHRGGAGEQQVFHPPHQGGRAGPGRSGRRRQHREAAARQEQPAGRAEHARGRRAVPGGQACPAAGVRGAAPAGADEPGQLHDQSQDHARRADRSRPTTPSSPTCPRAASRSRGWKPRSRASGRPTRSCPSASSWAPAPRVWCTRSTSTSGARRSSAWARPISRTRRASARSSGVCWSPWPSRPTARSRGSRSTARRAARVLDAAVERIVMLASPFKAFPANVRRETDILHITRTWSFTRSDLLLQ